MVSIGLGVRNGDKYLREALDSLLAQTYQNFEFIISDNASNDDTRKICEEYANRDNRIRYIRQKEDIGGLQNYDFVRREACGEYFMLAANDDLWDSRFIEKCLAKFKEFPDAIGVFPNFLAFDDSGMITEFSPEKYFPFPHNIYSRLKTYILSRAQYGKLTLLYSLWKRDSMVDIISKNEQHSDMSYLLKSLFKGYFVFIDEVLFFKRAITLLPTNNVKWPSLNYLTNLPPDHPIKSVDEWHVIRRGVERRSCKRFITNRLQATKYFILHSKYIFRASILSWSEKVGLFLWNFWAYLKSMLYGYL